MRKLITPILLVAFLLAVVPVTVQADDNVWFIDGDKVFVNNPDVYLSATPHTLGSSGWVEFELLSKRFSGNIDVALGFQSSNGITMKKPQIWASNVPHERYCMVEAEKVGILTVTGIVAFTKLDWAAFEGEPDIGNRNNIHLYEVTALFWEWGELETLTVAFNDYILDGDTATVTYNYDSWEREVYYEYYPDWKPFIAEFDRHSEVAYGADTWDIVSTDAPIEADRLYKLRVWVEIPFAGLDRISGKYVFGVKPSNETVGEARENGHLYVIDPWWDSSWTYRKELTFDNSASTENLEWFPVLVHLDDTNIDWANVQNAGQDIRFVDSDDTTELDYEIEKWDDTNDAWIWVEVPQIDAGSITDFIYMYYGNNGASDGQDVDGTWDENGDGNYIMVQHMYDAPDNAHITDSTNYSNDGAKVGVNEPIEVAGSIAQAQEFDGNDDYVNCGNSTTMNFDDDFTIEAIVNPSYLGSIVKTIADKAWWNQPSYFLGIKSGKLYSGIRVTANVEGYVSDTADEIYDNFFYVVAVYNRASYIRGYINGSLENTKIDISGQLGEVGHTDTFEIGGFSAGYRWTGIIDEVRLSRIARSTEWIEAQHLSMTDAFITFGGETPVPANPPTDFTLTQVEDYQVDASWTLGAGNTNVMLRRKVGSYPADRTDGVSVYEGAGTSVSDTADDVGLELDKYTYYYRIWGQNALGVWSTDYAEGTIGGANMTYLFMVLAAVGLTITMFHTRNMMLGFPSLIFWAVLAGFAYTQSASTWDWQYFLFFASMGMVIFSALAMYGLYEKRETVADEEMEHGEGNHYIDEESGREIQLGKFREIGEEREHDDGFETRPSRRTQALHDRTKKRREGVIRKRTAWGGFR